MRLPPGTRIRTGAILFDMDGTLIDSSATIERIWRRWAGRHGIDADALMDFAVGRRLTETIRRFAVPGMDVAAEAMVIDADARAATDGVVAVPGADAFLRSLPDDRWAVVTSAPTAIARRWLAAARLPMPRVFVAAEDVSAGKPDPEGYRLALARLDRSAEEAVVFEDTVSGLEAGRAAGARTIAIAASLGAADRVREPWIADFSDVAVEAGADVLTIVVR